MFAGRHVQLVPVINWTRASRVVLRSRITNAILLKLSRQMKPESHPDLLSGLGMTSGALKNRGIHFDSF